MPGTFYEQPILNSPYSEPVYHHPLDDYGQPLEQPAILGRRTSKFIVPVPKSRKASAAAQASLDLETYTPNSLINEIRGYVNAWRQIPNQADWGVTPASARLLDYWRNHQFSSVRPFFCQVEAVETIIWLTEVAPKRAVTKGLLDQIQKANEEANPALFRLAMKMATGSGKTTVMAMLIAWQTVNAVRRDSKLFSRAFLIVAPGITIKDRLRVLMPSAPDNYYEERELVPPEMLNEVKRAEIVITNYHAFQHRETGPSGKVAKGLLQGNDPEPIRTTESDGEMLRRACGDLLNHKNVNVINDEAHHCYRHKTGGEEEKLTGDDKKEAEANEEAARLWINGIEGLKRKVGVRAVLDLSATPFFLRGSGYPEGFLFPWVVSDFSLMDAIECGIVKLPRVPVADNLPQNETLVYRDLWKHVGKSLPKSAAAAGKLDPSSLPNELKTALYALYSHYKLTFDLWEREAIDVPPVFIVVCQNTAISKLVFEWIAGFERDLGDDGSDRARFEIGNLDLFSNYDPTGGRFPRPRTLLIDSRQVEAGDALDKGFRDMAEAEIEQFKRDLIQRDGAGAGDKVSDGELLREVMNTVGRKGKLGEQIRCVVSVSMLTEGWDTNTVNRGDRDVHGNVSFNAPYFQRAIAEAMQKGLGISLLHSHPLGRGWQGMSADDIETERAIAAPTFGATELPLLGMTLSGDGKWSARFWNKVAPREYVRNWCRSVRIAGDSLGIDFNPALAKIVEATDQQVRTVSSWGPEVQADLARMRFCIVGAGSVGGFIAEALARMGARFIYLIDFDHVGTHNLDRLCYANKSDVGKLKVDVLDRYLRTVATSDTFESVPIVKSVADPEGLMAALDCDVTFSCVDRPWGRHILNQVAYAHLIPVIDGGISIRVGKNQTMKGADWRSHVATISRKCLCCLGQYNTGMVQSEREGLLDDPKYINGLPDGHPYKSRENVFAFSMACASDMMLQFLAYFVNPVGYSNMGARVTHFVGGRQDDPDFDGCEPNCLFAGAIGNGDRTLIC